MPELPEVETVRRGLEALIGTGARIHRIELTRPDLRRAIPPAVAHALAGARILAIDRRAKYLLWRTDAGVLVSHLGMTGSWRLAPPGDERRHDHCYVHLEDGRRLAFRDPRRFGLLDFVPPGAAWPALAGLGPEPLDARTFSAAYLAQVCAGRRAPIKALIMDQRVVVGVGNIYAQEALFRAGIAPRRAAGRLGREGCAALVRAIRAVLRAALRAGGSTISDYRQAGGADGHFQHRFQVYDRAGQPCPRCGATLRGGTVGGRGTTWCPRCQR